jgi:hypothetical protein
MYGLAQASETYDETLGVVRALRADPHQRSPARRALQPRLASRSVRTRANELRAQSESLRASLGRSREPPRSLDRWA